MASEKGRYVGVKFTPVLIEERQVNDSRIAELIEWGKIFHELGLAPPYVDTEGNRGSYGNLGVRSMLISNAFIITASSSSLAEGDDRNFAEVKDVSFRERKVYYIGGKRKSDKIVIPSSEAILYWTIFSMREDVDAILHGHSELISQCAERLCIPVTEKEEPYGTIELARQVRMLLERYPETDIFEMRHHGFVAMGRDIKTTGDLVLRTLRGCYS
jgi:ribulose-5-phosphate 4-epimerase/fuculose-1-phosphate aldolase